MPNPFGAPEVSVQDVKSKQEAGDSFVWLDVRETEEYDVSIDDERIVRLPLSTLAAEQLDAIPNELSDQSKEVIIFCHHGMRSAQVTAWLAQNGWTNVHNMDGGIHAWAEEVDPSVGTY